MVQRRGGQPRSRAACVAVTLVLGAALGGCSGDGSDATSSTTAASERSTTTTALVGAASSSTTAVGAPAVDAVDPASVPDGYRALRGEGVSVGLAVPETWVDVEVGDGLAEDLEELAEEDPQLAGMLGQASGLLGDATSIAALGPDQDVVREAAVVVQLGLALPTIPEQLVAQLEQQLASYGATDVATERIVVPGLAEGARALKVAATLEVGGAPTRLRLVLVPTDAGIVLVTVRADDATADAVLRTVAAG